MFLVKTHDPGTGLIGQCMKGELAFVQAHTEHICPGRYPGRLWDGRRDYGDSWELLGKFVLLGSAIESVVIERAKEDINQSGRIKVGSQTLKCDTALHAAVFANKGRYGSLFNE